MPGQLPDSEHRHRPPGPHVPRAGHVRNRAGWPAGARARIGGQAWWEPYGDDHAQRTSHQVHKWQMGVQEAGLHRSWLRLY